MQTNYHFSFKPRSAPAPPTDLLGANGPPKMPARVSLLLMAGLQGILTPSNCTHILNFTKESERGIEGNNPELSCHCSRKTEGWLFSLSSSPLLHFITKSLGPTPYIRGLQTLVKGHLVIFLALQDTQSVTTQLSHCSAKVPWIICKQVGAMVGVLFWPSTALGTRLGGMCVPAALSSSG